MDNTLYIALSKQAALRRQMDMVAHNMANINTGGYKSEGPLFIEYIESPARQKPLTFVQDYGTVRDLSAGPMVKTGNQLDVAIHGDAYFAVDTERGTRYTRNGHFEINAKSELVTSAGYPLLDVDSRKILIPQGETEFTIGTDGTLSGRLGQIARLKLVAFDQPRALKREADSLMVSQDRPIEPRDATVVQGMLETSNVKPIRELTSMIDLLRSYQSNNDLIRREEELQQKTVERVMRV